MAHYRKWLFLAMAALVIAIFGWYAWPGQAGMPVPGSEGDPLISRSYLESYLASHYGSVGDEIARLNAKVADLERRVKELEEKSGNQPPGPANSAEIVLRVGEKTAYIGGKPQDLIQAPLQVGNVVLVPFRFIGEALGAEVTYAPDTMTIGYRLGGRSLTLVIGRPWVEVNGERHELEAAPRLVGGVSMVPLRVVGQYLGATVRWDGSKKEVVITP